MMNTDTVDHALREVKEYAARSSDLSIDSLQVKLMHLEEVARRASHKDRELYSMVLQRFLCNKQHPKIGFLISSLLSSAAESKLLDKEHKFLKLHAKDSNAAHSGNTEAAEKEKKQPVNSEVPVGPYMMPFITPPYISYPPRLPPFLPRSGGPIRHGFGRGRPRFPYQTDCCFKCGDPSHFQINCPKK